MNNSLQRLLLPYVQARFGPHAQLNEVQSNTIRREVRSLRLQVVASEGTRVVEWRLVGKTMRNPQRGEKTFQLMRCLWNCGFAREAEDGICIPEPLGFVPELGALFMEEAPGRKIRNMINKDGDPAHMKLLARTLAKLHRCPLVTERRTRLEDQIPNAHEELAEAFPELAESIKDCVATVHAVTQHFSTETCTLVHGDFHLAQVLFDGQRAWLLDLDGVKLGDPAGDLGNVLVLLHGKEEQLANLRELMKSFWEEYFAIMPASIAGRVPLYLGLALLRRACKFFREQAPEAESRIGQMVALAAACMSKMPTQNLCSANHHFSEIAALLYADTTNAMAQ